MRAILVAGTIALGSVGRWLETKEGELRERFPSFFAYPKLHRMEPVRWESVRNAAEESGPWTDPARSGAMERLYAFTSVHRSHPALISPEEGTILLPMGEDGFFAALWKLNELTGCGSDIDLTKVPLRQETIEYCEYFGEDPYQADSTGAFLLATEDGASLFDALMEEGVPASLIGFQTRRRAGIIRCREHVRCLDRPVGW